MKRIISMIMAFAMFLSLGMPVHAAGNIEQFKMVEAEYDWEDDGNHEASPCTQYIVNVEVYLKKKTENSVYIRGDIWCDSTMDTLKGYFYLQKNYGDGWVNVSSNSATIYNNSSYSKTMIVSDLTPGLYRAKFTGQVTDDMGYTEAVTNYTGSLTID